MGNLFPSALVFKIFGLGLPEVLVPGAQPWLSEPGSAVAMLGLGAVQLLVHPRGGACSEAKSTSAPSSWGRIDCTVLRVQLPPGTSGKSWHVLGPVLCPLQYVVLQRGTDSSCWHSRVPSSITNLAISLPVPILCSLGYHSHQQPQGLAAAAG